jgi:hypothetical protein
VALNCVLLPLVRVADDGVMEMDVKVDGFQPARTELEQAEGQRAAIDTTADSSTGVVRT